jgi:hypothetical protein
MAKRKAKGPTRPRTSVRDLKPVKAKAKSARGGVALSALMAVTQQTAQDASSALLAASAEAQALAQKKAALSGYSAPVGPAGRQLY